MADLLGSILKSMDKPPAVDEKQKQLIKKHREAIAKQEEEMKRKLSRFRQQVENVINQFMKDEKNFKHNFQPVPKVYRAVIHEVAEIAGLTAYSFGEEDVDRYVMVFKKEHAPCDEELACYRRGEKWDPAAQEERKKLQVERERLLAEAVTNQRKAAALPEKFREKYGKFLGTEAGIEAARVATPNKQFGNVPSENKKDARTIEQVLADNQARKRQKLNAEGASSSTGAADAEEN